MSTDILITSDTTGSIYPALAEIKRRVSSFIDKAFDSITDLRIGIITHGDYCDGISAINTLRFSKNRDEIREFILEAPKTDGGDSDEFYELILRKAHSEFDWQADNKILIMIGDAEPHEPGYRFGGQVYNIDWEKEARLVAEKGIKIYAVQALGRKGSDYFYKGLANYSNGYRVELNQFADVVETILAACYHVNGRLKEYEQELSSTFKMNRNLAAMFEELGAPVRNTVFTKSDASGLIPVPPSRFQVVMVDRDTDIKSFVISLGIKFKLGRGFYQFMKSEMVQEHKEVVLRNKRTGDMFTGAEARNFIGLPFGERGKIKPKLFDDYEVFIQSTSPNRKLIAGYKFLYENS